MRAVRSTRAPEGPDQGKGEIVTAKTHAAKDRSRNVWLQLGFPDAEEHYLKAELVLRLDKAIRALGLTQRAAARRIGTTQPELSKSYIIRISAIFLLSAVNPLTLRFSP
jgi:predicted XRE-type DNA-binding protein